MAPRMIVVGGPPGSGKSTAFPVRAFGVDAFNVDDRCRDLHGSYAAIPRDIRARASAECEAFVLAHIEEARDFAVETTMRTRVSIEQARAAQRRGFTTMLFFLATGDPQIHVDRIRARAFGGGHAAPAAEIVATYAAAIDLLPEAVATFNVVELFDTGVSDEPPRWVATGRSRAARSPRRRGCPPRCAPERATPPRSTVPLALPLPDRRQRRPRLA